MFARRDGEGYFICVKLRSVNKFQFTGNNYF